MKTREFTIKVRMEERWIPHFLGMLKSMEYLGSIGSSEWVEFYSDGDGDFRPKFDWDKDVDCVEYIKDRKRGEAVLEFDAGNGK